MDQRYGRLFAAEAMIEPKIRFIVSGRLSKDKPFRELSVSSKFFLLDAAQKRMEEWLISSVDLPKAKPEAQIGTEELPYILDCKDCGTALFKDEIVYYTRLGIFCYECSETTPDGFYDLLDYPVDNENFSLDKSSGI